jgi:hypothetical protein
MYSNNKLIRDVADIAAQIMSGQQKVDEKLHPNQQKLDVHEPEKDELTSDDFKKLRAGKKNVKEETVEEEETETAAAAALFQREKISPGFFPFKMISRHLDPRSVMKLIGRTSRAI